MYFALDIHKYDNHRDVHSIIILSLNNILITNICLLKKLSLDIKTTEHKVIEGQLKSKTNIKLGLFISKDMFWKLG